ncbi:MMPL family transporter [Kocuria palustris]|uniref:MMPL family transporter n=1 Tax=Kocuria palustris TaxID=71999 RepID=UPI0019D018BC|nr:MMPL family transporter [Kocuria palustris]MBN6752957.1 MMPL family transporter [Kocuria palustris]MBN6757952.1 MMPL family transporter [Kocuria palustris]MBN6762980.1 MMPL family transporter [Kocuria palustris]MBN6782479.1 MMPL family transporter [Kocuria palustris]MBN6799379.1 MMPL family transporter [Kocuria palustris]
MAKFLYRLGRGAATRAWVAIITWLVLLGLAGGAFAAFGGTLSNSFEIPGTETQQLADRLADELPEANQGMGTVVFSTEDGSEFTDEQKTEIGEALDAAADVDGMASAMNPFDAQADLDDQRDQVEEGAEQLPQLIELRDSGRLDAAVQAGMLPEGTTAESVTQQEQQLQVGQDTMDMMGDYGFVSPEGSTAVATVNFDEDQMSIEQSTKDDLMAAVEDHPVDGVEVDYSTEIAQEMSAMGAGEIVGVVVAVVVLLIMLRTAVGAALPVLTAFVGVGFSTMLALSLSGQVQMASVTPMLGVMLGLAVGIDYSLFLLNRYRTELRRGTEVTEAIGLATGTAGSAVAFAGMTVMIALIGLSVTGIPFLALMGAVAALAVLVAVLITLTLTPALLGLVGKRLLPKSQRDVTVDEAEHVKTPLAVRRPLPVLLAAVAALAILAIPMGSMRLGLPDGSTEPQDSTQYRAYETVAEDFGAGKNGPMTVVADLPEDADEQSAQELQLAVGQEVSELDDVASVVPSPIDVDSGMALLQVVPESGPSDEATETLVDDIRGLSGNVEAAGDPTIGVAGTTAANIDVSQVLSNALPVYLAVVVAISMVLLILVFRSILVPVIASLGFLLSLLAAFGAVVAVYQWGWLSWLFNVTEPGPVLSFLPTLMVGILFGLAMDYQLFLVTGMREAHVHGYPARTAVVRGMVGGRAVVTAAAIIMTSVFAGFIFSHMAMIRPMGFGLATGVLFDAFLVRMTIIPALMTLLGEKAWWFPRWLDRILPNVDVEGESLQQGKPQAEAAASRDERLAREVVAAEEEQALAGSSRSSRGRHAAE